MEQALERGALYVVGTPIGNLGDFSPRARETLEAADFIAAEDTRVTLRLLNHFGIKKPLISYFEHNKLEHGPLIVARLQEGQTCALVSDAGMPAISDPGETLVAACAAAGLPVYVVPGPTAALSALAISGLPTGRFTFEGFLPMNKKNRRAHLESLQGEARTMLFHEAPHKLLATLKDLAETFGPDRRVALCRELTKLHEEVLRTTLGQAVAHYTENPPKGEFVLVVEGAALRQEEPPTLEEGLALVNRLRGEGWSTRDAVKEAASRCGLPRKALYDLAVANQPAP